MNADDVTEKIFRYAYVGAVGIVVALAIYVLALGGYCFCRHIWTVAFPQTPAESEARSMSNLLKQNMEEVSP